VEVKFDATRWFKQAKPKSILALARCGWRGDYAADDVAMYMADHNENVSEMFDYIRMRNRIETIGFECSVNEEDAKAWLAENCPKVLKKIMRAAE
jgi:hypothetical protein